jgi:hypothetical protein
VVALAEPGEHAVAAHPEEQVAVQEPRPAAEHRLFRQAHVPRQLFADQVFEARVARHGSAGPDQHIRRSS